MKKTMIISLIGSFSTLLANAELSEFKEKSATPHRLFVDPNILWSHGKGIGEEGSLLYRIKINNVFYGLRAGYEYVQQNSVYAGVDGLYSFGKSQIDLSRSTEIDLGFFGSSPHYPAKLTFSGKNNHFANGEGRIGYAFQTLDYLTLTPFVGIGGYSIKNNAMFSISQNWVYAAGGLRTSFAINSTFELGINAKAMRTGYVKTQLKRWDFYSFHPANFWGYEIDVPFTYHLGTENNWTAQIEPYFLKLDVKSNTNIYGGKILLTYCF